MFLHYHGLDTLHITTRLQAKAAGQAISKVYGVGKDLDPHLKPEHQSRNATNVTPKQAQPKSNVQFKARKLISISIKHLGKSDVGNTTTITCTDTPSSMYPIPEASRQPHYFPRPPLPALPPPVNDHNFDLVPLGKYTLPCS